MKILITDEPISTSELIRLIGESIEKKVYIWRFSKWIMNTFADIGGMLRLPLNKQRLQKLTENYVVSNQKIKNALEIKNMPISSREGIRKTIKSFR